MLRVRYLCINVFLLHFYVFFLFFKTAVKTCTIFRSFAKCVSFTYVGCVARTVNSPNQHLFRTDDVISCCLDLSAPSISFRINGQPVQGMFENFNIDGLFFPVVSFSAGIKLASCVVVLCFFSQSVFFPVYMHMLNISLADFALISLSDICFFGTVPVLG